MRGLRKRVKYAQEGSVTPSSLHKKIYSFIKLLEINRNKNRYARKLSLLLFQHGRWKSRDHQVQRPHSLKHDVFSYSWLKTGHISLDTFIILKVIPTSMSTNSTLLSEIFCSHYLRLTVSISIYVSFFFSRFFVKPTRKNKMS